MEDDYDFENYGDRETFDGYEPQPRREPEPQPQPAAPPRWTAADNIRYAKKSAGLNQVRDDIDAGVLYPEHAEPIVRDLTNDLNQMDQQKAAFDGLQQQSATQAALGQNAMARAVQQADQNHAADGFLSTMRTFIDPVTGQSATFFQAKPGQWTQVSLPEGGSAMFSPGEGKGGGSPDGDPMLASAGAGKGRFDQTIQNGPWIDQFGGGRLVGTNRPQDNRQQGGGEMFGLAGDTMQQIEATANAAAMHMPPGVQRNALVSHVKQRLIMSAIQERAAGQRQTAVAEQRSQAESEKEWRDLRSEAHRAIANEDRAAAKDGLPSKYTRAADRLKAADELAQEQWAARHPETPRAQAWVKAQGAKGSATEAVTPAGPPTLPNIMAFATMKTGGSMTSHEANKALNEILDTVKEDTSLADNVADPDDPSRVVGGPWNQLPPQVQMAEAVRRFAKDLEVKTGRRLTPPDSRPQQPAGQAPAAAQPQQPQQQPARQTIKLPPDLKAKYDAINATHGAAYKAAAGAVTPGAALQRRNDEERQRHADMPERYK